MSDGIRLDKRGMGQMLRTETARITNRVAQLVAKEVQPPEGSGIRRSDVRVREYTTDRAAASVDVNHENAMEAQLQHGLLTRAAGAVGLGVTGR